MFVDRKKKVNLSSVSENQHTTTMVWKIEKGQSENRKLNYYIARFVLISIRGCLAE